MMKIMMAVLSLIALAALAAAAAGPAGPPTSQPAANPDRLTETFLGPGPAGNVTLMDVHPLHGGADVYVSSSGDCIVRIVSQAQQTEERYQIKLSAEESAALRAACLEANLAAVEIKPRPGIPDESRPTIILGAPAGGGKRVSLSKWANDKVPAFDLVYKSLADLRLKTTGLKPEYRGPYQPDWKLPVTAATSPATAPTTVPATGAAQAMMDRVALFYKLLLQKDEPTLAQEQDLFDSRNSVRAYLIQAEKQDPNQPVVLQLFRLHPEKFVDSATRDGKFTLSISRPLEFVGWAPDGWLPARRDRVEVTNYCQVLVKPVPGSLVLIFTLERGKIEPGAIWFGGSAGKNTRQEFGFRLPTEDEAGGFSPDKTRD